MYRDLVARDGAVCQRCGGEIDMMLEYPDRWSKSLDHIVPISRGGRHVLDNVQLMHFWCNSAKGNRP
jgi:5-methylcytosine-specific restriction endonuclease McrA